MPQLWVIPIASTLVSVALFVWAWVRKVDSFAGPALAWLGFSILEYGVESRLFCDEECNIRLDLLLLPILAVWTLVVVFRYVGRDRDAA